MISIILLKLTIGGSTFFLQRRNGFHGRPFDIIKLRTLYIDSDEEETIEKRTNAIGFFIRSFSIDEIPQFINVIKGDMTLIGPRPHPIELDELYLNELPNLRERYSILPGITGLAQVMGARGSINSRFDMRLRLHYDFKYIKFRSIQLNVYIIIKTIMGGFISK